MTPTERAATFYLTAIRDGLPEKAVADHVGPDYIQHNQHVSSGKDAFIANFISFAKRHPVRGAFVKRKFVDGRLVFLHVCQDLHETGGIWVTMDLLRVDEHGRIVEHWDNLARGTAADLDGPTEVRDLEQTGNNKAIVRKLVDTWLAGALPISPGVPGSDRLMAWRPARCHVVVGQGCFVVAVLEGSENQSPTSFWVLFRLEDGEVAQVWALSETLRPPAECPHDNGKFGFPQPAVI